MPDSPLLAYMHAYRETKQWRIYMGKRAYSSPYAVGACMMTSSNGNFFRVTGPLWGESTGQRWIPLTKGEWRGSLMFLCCYSEQAVEQTLDKPVIRDVMTVMWSRPKAEWNASEATLHDMRKWIQRNRYEKYNGQQCKNGVRVLWVIYAWV